MAGETLGLPGSGDVNPLQMILQGLAGGVSGPGNSPLPSGGGTPGVVGQMSSPAVPTNRVPSSPGGSPLPSFGPPMQTEMGPQAQGPARHGPPNMGQQSEFRTHEAARNQTVREIMQGIARTSQQIQQQRFEKGVAQAKDASMKYQQMVQKAKDLEDMAASLPPGQRGPALQMADQARKEAEAFKNDPKQGGKALKNIDKVMSPAWVGAQQAAQEMQKQNEIKTAQETKQADMQKKMADAVKAQAQAAAEAEKSRRMQAGLPTPDAQERARAQIETAKIRAQAELEKTRRLSSSVHGQVTKTENIYSTKEDRWYERAFYKDGFREYIPYPPGVVPERQAPSASEKTTETVTTESGEKISRTITTKGFAIGKSSPLNPYKGIDPALAVKKGGLSAIDHWARWVAAGGKTPPGTGKEFNVAVANRIAELNLPMNAPPSAMAQSRAAAAMPLIQKDQTGKDTFDKAEDAIRLWANGPKDAATVESYKKLQEIAKSVGQSIDPNADGDSFITRWKDVVQKELGTLPPQAAAVQAYLTSIYSFAGSFHGWRALAVARAFQEDFGGIRTNPASTITSLEIIRRTAELAAMEGNVAYRMQHGVNTGATPSGGQTPPAQTQPTAPKKMTVEELEQLAFPKGKKP